MSVAKRARKETAKTFEDYTVAELKEMVQQTAQLREQKSTPQDSAVVAERVRAVLAKQLLSQIMLDKELSEKQVELSHSAAGREISVVLPNVTSDVMTELGLDKRDQDNNIKGKHSDKFFENPPSRGLVNGAFCLKRDLNFKYTSRSCELKVTAAYRFVPKPKPKPKAKARVQESAGAAGDAAVGDAEEDEGEEVGADDEEAEGDAAELTSPPKAGAADGGADEVQAGTDVN